MGSVVAQGNQRLGRRVLRRNLPSKRHREVYLLFLTGTNTDPGSQYADPEGYPGTFLVSVVENGGYSRHRPGGALSERYPVTNKLLPMNENGMSRPTPAARNRGKWAYRDSDSAI
ncbi:hypothetical protein F5144DRAFT_542891 [Chaetomium tenue]|uniref:Uncharacterized protein n=1 Tax=Chaetomium tenue TaxID=1854479 RepID=A0ACB7PKV9_9PEZI|nr:hypothetical protein F5144DRAFT_542891 [Chaetomium globosum]